MAMREDLEEQVVFNKSEGTIFRCKDGCEGVFKDSSGIAVPHNGTPTEERNHPERIKQ